MVWVWKIIRMVNLVWERAAFDRRGGFDDEDLAHLKCKHSPLHVSFDVFISPLPPHVGVNII